MRAALEGKRILVLRPQRQAGDLAAALEARGATPVLAPAVKILPPQDPSHIDSALSEAASFDWAVFTSVNGVSIVQERMQVLGLTPQSLPARIAAVGPSTAEALSEAGCPKAWIPGRYTTAALAEELPDPPGRVLLFRAEVAGARLERRLEERGFKVQRVHAYRTEAAGGDQLRAAMDGGVDGIAFTSASIVAAFAGAAPGLGSARVFCIGPATAEACREAGFPIDAESAEHTIPGLVETMGRFFAALGE